MLLEKKRKLKSVIRKTLVNIVETIPWRTNGYEKKYLFIQTVLIKNPPIALLEQNTVKLHFLIMIMVTIYLKNLLVYL